MNQPERPSSAETVALLALTTSLVAFAIDAMLPALGEIARDLGARGDNDRQLVLTALFLGTAVAQIVYGPVSDSAGRKPAIYGGFVVFIAGCLVSMLAQSFTVMLVGRFLQGIGAAGPRIVSIALVRDQYEGRAMARIMSMVMSVFILAPVVAPMMGQGVMIFSGWRAIFGVLCALAVVNFAWFAARQPETLPPERRAPFSLGPIARAALETARSRVASGYTVAAGLLFGAFVGYLATSQQILQVQYGTGAAFPFYFAANALTIGAASLVNAHLVMRFGMQLLSGWAQRGQVALSVAFLIVTLVADGHPPLWAFMAYTLLAFFCIGVLFANFNTLAMEPMGHIAGVASAVIGSITTFISLGIGTLIGMTYDGTVTPLVAGFAALGLGSLGAMWMAERGRGGGTSSSQRRPAAQVKA